MNEQRQYKNKLTEPPEGSRYEFCVHAFSLLTHYPPAPLHYPACPIPEGLSIGDRRLWEWRHREATDNAATWEYLTREEMRANGFTSAELDAPKMAAVIRDLAFQKRILVDMRSDAPEAPAPLAAPYDKWICQKVIFLASDVFGAGPARLADILTEGKRTVSAKVDADHVARAERAFFKNCAASSRYRSLGPAALELDAACWRRTFMAVEHVRLKARENQGLRSLKGAALAEEIDARYCLPAAVAKAEALPEVERKARLSLDVWATNYASSGVNTASVARST